ncbi:diguanylate cyclase (GGDEF)-like protein/PAS domain S-box-containing protein [Luteibacter sp. 621]|uniref:sensor domain-containing protein n=1 Tax=Luteibacter sp. 621 TaxID=3373916 RepID=UPI003D1AF8D6
MPQERHKLLSRLIDRSIGTSLALVILLPAATLAATWGVLAAQHRLADAYRTLIAADAISSEVQAMRLSMASWVLRGDAGSRAEWIRLSQVARVDLGALRRRSQTDPQGRLLIGAVTNGLNERIDTATPLLATRAGEPGDERISQMMAPAYQARNNELATALARLRSHQIERVDSLQQRERRVLIGAGAVLVVLVTVVTLSLRRARRTARAVVRNLRDAFRAVEHSRAELAALTDAAPLAMVHTDLSGVPLWTNSHAARWLSATAPADVTDRLHALLHPDDKGRVRAAWQRLLGGAERFDQIFRLESGMPQPTWAEAHAVPVRVNGTTTGFIAVMQDVTATRVLQEELGRSQTRLQRMMDAVPALMAHIDVTETYQFVNATYAAWFGEAAPRVGSTIRDFLGESAYLRLKPSIDTVISGRAVRLEMAQSNLHGLAFVGEVSYTPEFDESGRVCGFYVLVTDVTHRKTLEDGLYAAKEMAQVTLDSLGDAVITTDETGIVTFLNRRARKMLAPVAHRALGVHVDQVIRLVDRMGRVTQTSLSRAIEEERLVDMLAPRRLVLSEGGDGIEIEDVAAPIRMRDGIVVGGVLVLRDVSIAQSVADRMRHLAESDALTGLSNRMAFDEHLARALRERTGTDMVAILFMDLDGFKAVNDVHGHAAGDELLKQAAARFLDVAQAGDVVCRLGGDEFAALLSPGSSSADALRRARAFVRIAGEPFPWSGMALHVTLSVGIAVSPCDGTDAPTLLRNADTALYEAKEAGKNRVRLYSEDVPRA